MSDNIETWKSLIDYPNYKISNLGCVRTKLTKNKITKSYLMRVLVAKAFILNPDNKPEVNHLAARDDNRASMLEWVTKKKENYLHAAKNITKMQKVSVQQIDLKTNKIIKTYDRIFDVKTDGFDNQRVHWCINGKLLIESEPYIHIYIWFSLSFFLFFCHIFLVRLVPLYKHLIFVVHLPPVRLS